MEHSPYTRRSAVSRGGNGTAEANQQLSIENEMNVIRAAMQLDPFFGWTWHCSVAASMQDEGVDHRTSNLAAARFMKSAFSYDSTKTQWFKEFQGIWKKLEEASKVEEQRAEDGVVS